MRRVTALIFFPKRTIIKLEKPLKDTIMIIECKALTKHYLLEGKKIKAVDNVDLAVDAGDFVVVLGHSGSGKTTLLSLIGGLTKPDDGQVFINGVENWRQPDQALSTMRSRAIGFIFQFASLIPTLTVLENMLLPLTFGGVRPENADDAHALLDKIGLADKANAFPSMLSGGQQRRIAIARAFMNRPAIILADEPTGDLDEETENDILALFREYNRQGTTFVVVTHNQALGETQDAPRVIRMRNGVIHED